MSKSDQWGLVCLALLLCVILTALLLGVGRAVLRVENKLDRVIELLKQKEKK